MFKKIKEKFKKYHESEFNKEYEYEINIPYHFCFFILAIIALILYFIFK